MRNNYSDDIPEKVLERMKGARNRSKRAGEWMYAKLFKMMAKKHRSDL